MPFFRNQLVCELWEVAVNIFTVKYAHKNDFIPTDFDADPEIPHPDTIVAIVPAQFVNGFDIL